MRFVCLPIALLFAAAAYAQTRPAWVARSNQNTQLLINLDAKYSPEGAAAEGVKGLDEQISSFAADTAARECMVTDARADGATATPDR